MSKLPGVSKKAAEALYDAGYTAIDDVKTLSKEDLLKVKGVGPKTADAIIAGVAEGATAAGEDKVEVVEKATAKKTKGKDAKAEKKAAKEEIVEPETAYAPKIKAELPADVKHAFQVRKIRYSQQPAFRKYHWWYALRVTEEWRAPKGTLSKQRRGFKYRPPKVKVGFGKPALARGLHPSGFAEVLVANPDQLGLVTDPKTQAARIVGSVGLRKRKLIEAAAAEKNIRVLNPTHRRS